MRVYTSYFSLDKLIPQDFQKFSIALGTQYFFLGAEVPALQPTRKMLDDYKREGNLDLYRFRYIEDILGKLDVHKYWRQMEESFGDQTVVFFCWERPESFCHRHILGDWFTDTGYPVSELTFDANKEVIHA